MVDPLTTEQSDQLAYLVRESRKEYRRVQDDVGRAINDLYTGRDPASGGGLATSLPDPLKVFSWQVPKIGANLCQSRARNLVIDLVPAVPYFHAEPIVAAAAGYVEDQNKLSRWMAQNSGLKQAMRQAALYGLLGTHFGVKACLDAKAPREEDRIKFVAIPQSHCGVEPGQGRFKWHQYQCQWRDVPQDQKDALENDHELDPWAIVTKTEVYHEGFEYSGGKCPVAHYLHVGENPSSSVKATGASFASAENRPETGLGEYVGSSELPSCPLHIGAFLDPAPGEDIAPPEVASWVPILRSIHRILVQIERESNRINNVVLYDGIAIDESHIQDIINANPGAEVFVPVQTDAAAQAFERDNGVSHKMRPVERNSALGELVTALQTQMMLLEEVTGNSAMQAGIPQGPRKSAAEASILAQASNKRSRDRLTVMADAFSAAARAGFSFQRMAYGKSLSFAAENGVVHNIVVPDPKVARMAFRVEAVELGNLSKQGQVESAAASLTLLANLNQQAPGLITPDILISEARKALMGYGNYEAAERLKLPPQQGGPLERLRDYIYGRTAEIPVFEKDDHPTFIAAYQEEIQNAVLRPAANIPSGEIQRAITEHQRYADAQAPKQAEPQAPMSGFNTNGVPNNAIEAALQSGGVPFESPTNLTTF